MSTIFTIGYEGTDIERFVTTLTNAGVVVLADVRAVTVSRKRGFSKNGLRERLAEAGIRYVHFRELGDPKAGREAARAGRFDAFRTIYGEHLVTPEAQQDLSALAHLVADRPTCLMCFERDPRTCHRTIVAQSLSSSGHEVWDLYVERLELNDHAASRAGSRAHQGVAAAE